MEVAVNELGPAELVGKTSVLERFHNGKWQLRFGDEVTFMAPEQLDLRPDPQAHKEREELGWLDGGEAWWGGLVGRLGGEAWWGGLVGRLDRRGHKRKKYANLKLALAVDVKLGLANDIRFTADRKELAKQRNRKVSMKEEDLAHQARLMSSTAAARKHLPSGGKVPEKAPWWQTCIDRASSRADSRILEREYLALASGSEEWLGIQQGFWPWWDMEVS
eukprot:s737_g2.t1